MYYEVKCEKKLCDTDLDNHVRQGTLYAPSPHTVYQVCQFRRRKYVQCAWKSATSNKLEFSLIFSADFNAFFFFILCLFLQSSAFQERRKQMYDLAIDIQTYNHRLGLINELAVCIEERIHADGYTLYAVTGNGSVSQTILPTWVLSYKELRLIQINDKSSNQSQVCSLLSVIYIVAIDINRK